MPFPLLAVLEGASLISGLIAKKKSADKANKDAALQAEYQRAEAQRAIDDRNKESAAAEKARVARFNMAMGILRSMGDTGGIPKERLDMLEATRGKYDPIVYSSATTPPVTKQKGFDFFSTLSSLTGAAAQYKANKDQASDYADEYNSRISTGAKAPRAPALSASGQGTPSKFGSNVDFMKNRKPITQPFTFDDLYS